MTLYVVEKRLMGDMYPSMVQREASLRDKLTDRGWVDHNECEGGGAVSGFPDTPWEQCPSCVDGLVPPKGMVEAAAEAMHESVDREVRAEWADEPEWSWARVPENIRLTTQQHTRAALIAAARWEREQ